MVTILVQQPLSRTNCSPVLQVSVKIFFANKMLLLDFSTDIAKNTHSLSKNEFPRLAQITIISIEISSLLYWTLWKRVWRFSRITDDGRKMSLYRKMRIFFHFITMFRLESSILYYHIQANEKNSNHARVFRSPIICSRLEQSKNEQQQRIPFKWRKKTSRFG